MGYPERGPGLQSPVPPRGDEVSNGDSPRAEIATSTSTSLTTFMTASPVLKSLESFFVPLLQYRVHEERSHHPNLDNRVFRSTSWSEHRLSMNRALRRVHEQ